MPETTKVKQAVVTYVDGKRVGYNASGEREAEGPRKDKLKDEGVLDLSQVRTVSAYREGQPRNTAKPIGVAQIRPGDKISAGWAPNPAGAARPTSATVVQVEDPSGSLKFVPARTVTQLDHTQPQVPNGEPFEGANYPNTHQLVGGGDEERPDGLLDLDDEQLSQKLFEEGVELEGTETRDEKIAKLREKRQ